MNENNNYNLNNNFSSNNLNSKSKGKNNIIKILIPILTIGACLCIFFGIKGLIGNKNQNEQLSEEINSIPIIVANKENKKALYNSNGEKLTDFEYAEIKEFLGDVALFRKTDYSYGIIDNKGNVIADSTKYKSVSRVGYLFKVRDNNNNEYLINSNEKIIYNLKEIDGSVKTYYDSNKIIVVENDNFFDIIGISGKSILKLNKSNEDDSIKTYIEDDYASIFYKNTSYIINLDKEILVSQINSETPHYVNGYDDNNNDIYILTKNNTKEFKLMNKDQTIYSKECNNMFFSDNNVICVIDYKRYYLDNKGNLGVEYYSSNNIVMNYDTYISSENGNNIFYKDGKQVSTTKCIKSADSVSFSAVADKNEEIYAVWDSCDKNEKKYYYYYSNGKKFIDKAFKSLTNFDSNNLARVSEVSGKYYLINNKGEIVTNEYDSIKFNNAGYNEYTFHNSIYRASLNNEHIIINTKGKEIFKTTGEVQIYFNYFTVKENNTLTYYTLNGKEFYKN